MCDDAQGPDVGGFVCMPQHLVVGAAAELAGLCFSCKDEVPVPSWLAHLNPGQRDAGHIMLGDVPDSKSAQRATEHL